VYLDASALVKLVVVEEESAALQAFLENNAALVSCALSRVEVVRAARVHGADAAARARRVVDALDFLLELDVPLLETAADLEPPILRSLDAIHVAAALQLHGALYAMVTYDARMAAAARAARLAVVSPGA
jgi:predicted nucleic acid-binding protein